MPTVKAKCTNCGATFEVDSKKDAAICPHCKEPFVVEKAINLYNGISTDRVVYLGRKGPDELHEDAQQLIALGRYAEAAARLRQMVDEYPGDFRGPLAIIKLATDHIEDGQYGVIISAAAEGKTWLDPVKLARRTERKVGGGIFCKMLDDRWESVCKKVRSGETSLEWFWRCGYFNHQGFPCVAALRKEAEENAAKFEDLRRRIDYASHYSPFFPLISARMWGTGNIDSHKCEYLIGNGSIWRNTDAEHYYTYAHYALTVIVSEKKFDELSSEARRCIERAICPKCGQGRVWPSHKYGDHTYKCSVCGESFLRFWT